MGRKAVEKARLSKGYRHPQLDADLRSARTRAEARLFREARMLGVPVPIIYDVDLRGNKIVMEYVDGPTAKEVLSSGGDEAVRVCRLIGQMVGRLHRSDIIHGDLTTSNMLVRGGILYLVDFGMGEKKGDLEAKGVDLHLLKEAFLSAHSERADLFKEVLRGYRQAYEDADAVIAKAQEIERRGRYLRGS